MCSKIVHAIDSEEGAVTEVLLNSEAELLHHWIAQVVVDDIDARCAFAGDYRAGKSVIDCGGKWRECAIRLIHECDISEVRINRQRTSIESAFQRLEFEYDAIVVDTVSATNHGSTHWRPGKSNPRSPVVV